MPHKPKPLRPIPVIPMRKFTFVVLLFMTNYLSGQIRSIFPEDKMHYGLGFTGGSLNDIKSVSSGMSVYIGRDLLQMKNSSFSLSTNFKLGIQDKTYTGLEFPLILALLLILSDLGGDPNFSGDGNDNIKVNFFTEIPLTLHYNFGWGSNPQTEKNVGFYLGGGMSYVITNYTDTAGNTPGTSFFGWMIDGGIRLRGGLDINIANVISLRQPIGQIARPAFYELTISKYFR
jgi:hypothetical protein